MMTRFIRYIRSDLDPTRPAHWFCYLTPTRLSLGYFTNLHFTALILCTFYSVNRAAVDDEIWSSGWPCRSDLGLQRRFLPLGLYIYGLIIHSKYGVKFEE